MHGQEANNLNALQVVDFVRKRIDLTTNLQGLYRQEI